MVSWSSIRTIALFSLAGLLSIPFLFWELQPGQPLLNRTLAVTVFVATLWMTEAVPIPIASMMPLVLFPLLRIASADEVAKWYWNDTVFLFMASSLIACAMEKWKLHQRFALRLLTLVGNQPYLLLAGFMGITATISTVLSNSATCVMMTPLAISVVKNMAEEPESNTDLEGLVKNDQPSIDGEESRRRFRCGILLGVAYAASIGGFSTLIGTGTNLVFVRIFYNLFPHAPSISFLQWFVFAGPLALLFLACSYGILYFYLCREGILKRTVRFDTAYLKTQYEALGPISSEEKLVSATILTLVVLWFGQEWIESNIGADYGTIGIFFALLLYCCPAPSHPEKTILEWDEFGKQVPWGVLLLLGAGFSLAEAFEVSGLSLWIGVRLQFFGGFPIVVIVASVCTIITFLTELTSNAATATILLPIVAALCIGVGENPLLLMIPATLACSNAFMLPVATPPNAIVFASGSIRMKEMMTAGLALNLIGVVLNTGGILAAAPLFDIHLGHLPQWATYVFLCICWYPSGSNSHYVQTDRDWPVLSTLLIVPAVFLPGVWWGAATRWRNHKKIVTVHAPLKRPGSMSPTVCNPKRSGQDAYKGAIARYAVEHKKFEGCSSFGMARMTWIKPNFLWMMFRSKWGSKANQDHILAIWLKRSAFEKYLENARKKGSVRDFQGTVRLQWDPDHFPDGERHPYRRAVQLGLKNVTSYLNGTDIVDIQDISAFVHQQGAILRSQKSGKPVKSIKCAQTPEELLVARERVFVPISELARQTIELAPSPDEEGEREED